MMPQPSPFKLNRVIDIKNEFKDLIHSTALNAVIEIKDDVKKLVNLVQVIDKHTEEIKIATAKVDIVKEEVKIASERELNISSPKFCVQIVH